MTDNDFSIDALNAARKNKSYGSPSYSTIVDYPDSLALGDTLFPLLYIYYMGDSSNKSKVGNTALFEKALSDYVLNLNGMSHSSITVEDIQLMSKKFSLLFSSACKDNPSWTWTFSNAVSTIMKKYTSRLDFNPKRPLGGGMYYKSTGTDGSSKFSTLPSIDSTNSSDVSAVMETLRILFENGLIDYNYDLGVRPINIFTGELAQENEDYTNMQSAAKYLGLPTQGIFTVNKQSKGSTMYHTFSGIDIKALASLNTTVSELDRLLQCSWSIHKGSSSTRPLGKSSSGSRAKGSRTIAGTLIFAMSDHHPLRDIIPDTYPGRKTQILNSPDTWKHLVMADEIPPFDVVLTLKNEYGKACITTIYGMEVVDEGGVLGIDNLITEIVIQYTAMGMDPITEVTLDESGEIDPFGIIQGNYSDMWRKREMIAAGVGFSDLEMDYEAQYDAIFSKLEMYRKNE